MTVGWDGVLEAPDAYPGDLNWRCCKSQLSNWHNIFEVPLRTVAFKAMRENYRCVPNNKRLDLVDSFGDLPSFGPRSRIALISLSPWKGHQDSVESEKNGEILMTFSPWEFWLCEDWAGSSWQSLQPTQPSSNSWWMLFPAIPHSDTVAVGGRPILGHAVFWPWGVPLDHLGPLSEFLHVLSRLLIFGIVLGTIWRPFEHPC